MKIKCCSILFSIVLSASLVAKPSDGIVETTGGLVAGQKTSNHIWVFRGIPYANPPVGNRRWREPEPRSPWQGVRKADSFGPACPQPKTISTPIISEDCLYLNVWSPAKSSHDHLPVMVWIHGGGFSGGASSNLLPDGKLLYPGDKLAEHGVIVVSFNYRLGPFGFFAHPLLSQESKFGVSGNYGFLDQILALEWVRENIESFGGDPDRVTIFGESAGGQSVAALMASPNASGLFHQAISESGFGAFGMSRSLRKQIAQYEPLEKIGERIAEYFGCKGRAAIACMRGKRVDELLKLDVPALVAQLRMGSYAPVIDGLFLPKDPEQIFAAGEQAHVPLLLGQNKDEAAATAIILQTSKPPVKTVADYKALISNSFPGHFDDVWQLFSVSSDDQVKEALDRLFTAYISTRMVRRMARNMREIGAPTYFYHFTRVPPYSSQLTIAGEKLFGAFHSLELYYVFGSLDGEKGFEPIDSRLSKVIQTYWTTFVKTGNPNTKSLPGWPDFTEAADEPYLELGDAIRVGTHLSQKECDMFDRIMGDETREGE